MKAEKTEYIVQISKNNQKSWAEEECYKPALNFKQGVENLKHARKEEEKRICGSQSISANP
jgi:hypothetical protein